MANYNYYAMTDTAIAQVLGERLEQMRLEANIPQKQIAAELGISEGTYRSAINGKARLEVVIGILRVLGKLDNIDAFLPETPYSPMALLALEGKRRQRARARGDGDSEDTSTW